MQMKFMSWRFHWCAGMQPVSCDEQLSNGRIVRVSYRPLDIGGWLVNYEDVTDSQRAQAEVAFLAGHDMLTKLGNRTLFLDSLREALARIGDVAVLYLDLDRFKDVNDTLGHPTGDMLLSMVGRRFNNCFRQSDTVARLGGDEFAVVLTPGLHDAAESAARHLIEVLARPFRLETKRSSSAPASGSPWRRLTEPITMVC